MRSLYLNHMGIKRLSFKFKGKINTKGSDGRRGQSIDIHFGLTKAGAS